MSHATLYIGTSVTTATKDVVPSADTTISSYEKFLVDDVRALVTAAYQRPLKEPIRSFYLFIQTANMESQNALLKLLEEPPATAEFHLVVPHEEVLIDTVRSRLIRAEQATESVAVTHAFIQSSIPERLEQIAALAKNRDIEGLQTIRREVEEYAHEKHDQTLLQDLMLLGRYEHMNGASLKMLYEQLALSV